MRLTPWTVLGRPWDGWRRTTWVFLGLFLCRGVLLLSVLPPLEGWDEYQHLAYIVHIAETGQAPVFNQSFVPKSLLTAAASLPQPHWAVQHLGTRRAVDYAAYWSGASAASDAASEPPVPLYESQHCSLYYRLAAPLFMAAGGTADLRTSVAVLRLANVLLLAGALWLALGALRRACPDPRDAALLGLLIALHPYFLMNGARVANDALGVFLGTAVIVGCLAFHGPRLWRCSTLLGLLLGLAVLAKAVNLALLPLAALWATSLVIRRKVCIARGLGGACLVFAVFLAVVGPYFTFNLTHFHVLTPTQEAITNREAGRDLSEMAVAATRVDWLDHLRRMWLSDDLWSGGWSFLLPWERMRWSYQFLTGFALLGLLTPWAWRTRLRLALTAWPLTVCCCICLSFAAGLAFHSVQSELTWGRPTTLPHYAAAAWPWFLVLVYGGGACWSPRVQVCLAWLLAALFLGTELHGLFHSMVRAYSGQPFGVVALQRLAVLQPAFLGTPTLAICTAGVAFFVTAAVVVTPRRAGSVSDRSVE